MKILSFLLFALCLIVSAALHAEETNIFHENGYELVFKNDDPTLDRDLMERMVKTFYTVYPQMSAEFNPQASRRV